MVGEKGRGNGAIVAAIAGSGERVLMRFCNLFQTSSGCDLGWVFRTRASYRFETKKGEFMSCSYRLEHRLHIDWKLIPDQ